jgi:hypothetical protein
LIAAYITTKNELDNQHPMIFGLSPSQIFHAFNFALPAWVSLIIFPRKKFTLTLVDSTIFFMSILYTTLFLYDSIFGVATSGGDIANFFSLEGIKTLFKREETVLIGWNHYVAFDLFVARMILVDSQKKGIGHVFMIPVLILCLLFGPTGYTLYGVIVVLNKLRK